MLDDVDETTAGKMVDEGPRFKVFYTFSRIHGDLELDYHWFSLDPIYFSQGPGNYRVVAQNKCNDVNFKSSLGLYF